MLKPNLYRALVSLLFILSFTALVRAEDAVKTLEAHLSADGYLTYWLIQTDAAKRELQAPETDAPHLVDLGIFPSPLIELSERFKSVYNGKAVLSTAIKSVEGGRRMLNIAASDSMQVFLNGQLVAELSAPTVGGGNKTSKAIELPKGESNLVVLTGISAGYSKFLLSITDGNATRPNAGDTQVLKTANPIVMKDVLEKSISFMSAAPFLEQAPDYTNLQPMAAGLRLFGSYPVGLGTLKIALKGAECTPSSAELTLDKITNSVWRTSVTPGNGPFPLVLHAEVSSNGNVIADVALKLHSLKDLKARDASIGQALAETTIQPAHPLTKLAHEKFALWSKAIDEDGIKITDELAAKLESIVLDEEKYLKEESKGDPLSGKLGYFERSYLSSIDKSPQPYFAYVPTGTKEFLAKPKEAAKKFPLVIFLHGYVSDYNKHKWWGEQAYFNKNFEEQNCFLAIPFGRSNTDFIGPGEVDIQDVIAEMKRLYPIDESRIYIWGYSMGGMGVYMTVAANPLQYAGAVAMAARAYSPLLMRTQGLESLLPYKHLLVHAVQPLDLCENLVTTPMRIYHGAQDPIVNPEEANVMFKRMKELNCDVTLHMIPGDHYSGFEAMADGETLRWLLQQQQKPVKTPPKFKTFLSLFKGAEGNDDPTGKTVQRHGPAFQAQMRPFLIVYGTTGGEEATKKLKEQAEAYDQEWSNFAKGHVPVLADKDVTDEQKKNFNLFLFGEEQENSIHAAAQKTGKLPFVVKDKKFVLGERSLSLDGRGVRYCVPNPLPGASATSLIVICSGVPYGKSVGTNHKLDMQPDFIVYTPEGDGDGTGTNTAVLAGYFDAKWKVDPTTTWWFEK